MLTTKEQQARSTTRQQLRRDILPAVENVMALATIVHIFFTVKQMVQG